MQQNRAAILVCYLIVFLAIVELSSARKKKSPSPITVTIARNLTKAETLVGQGKLDELARAHKLAAATSTSNSMTDWYDSQYIGSVIVGTPGVVSANGVHVPHSLSSSFSRSLL